MKIEAIADGITLHVHVVPRAGRSGVAGERGEALLVRLHAAPVDGAANAELIALIAAALAVPKHTVTIVSGERSRRKRVHVSGIDAATAASRLGISLS